MDSGYLRLVLLAPMLFGCGEGSMAGDAGPLGDTATTDAAGPVGLEGVAARLYTDIDADDRTRRNNGIGAEDLPLAGHPVRLLGSDRTAVTDENGIVRFDGLAAGTYLFDADATEATTHNVAEHVVAAIAGGDLRITTLGDSLPVYGGTPRFDAVLETMLRPLAPINRVNVAVAGTTTIDWAVGGSYYVTLEPYMDDTDLFIVSLGGNDLLNYVSSLTIDPSDISGTVELVRSEVLAIAERMLVIVHAIQARNPNADVAYLVYPAYANSAAWQSFITDFVDPSLAPAALRLVQTTLRDAIRDLLNLLAAEDLVLADLYRLTLAEPIDPLLVDQLHFTTLGHRRVAEELFLSLGGIVVGGEPALEMPYEVGLP